MSPLSWTLNVFLSESFSALPGTRVKAYNEMAAPDVPCCSKH